MNLIVCTASDCTIKMRCQHFTVISLTMFHSLGSACKLLYANNFFPFLLLFCLWCPLSFFFKSTKVQLQILFPFLNNPAPYYVPTWPMRNSLARVEISCTLQQSLKWIIHLFFRREVVIYYIFILPFLQGAQGLVLSLGSGLEAPSVAGCSD